MLFHLLNLLARSLAAVPALLGSTWIGILFPIAVALVGELIGVVLFGWKTMIENWRKATGIGFAALGVGYAFLFVFCMVKTVYLDHVQLVAASEGYRSKLTTMAQDRDRELNELKLLCARNGGASGVLQQQLTSVQSELNTCLLQQKESPAFHTFAVSREGGTDPRMEYIFTTNVSRSPASVLATCDFPIVNGRLRPMNEHGNPAFTGDTQILGSNKRKFIVASPTWNADTPLFLTIFFQPPVNRFPSCSFSF